jgi:thymidylate synthase ThyX
MILLFRDLVYLRHQAQENLQHHVHETVPEEYQKCMMGMKRNLKQTLEIAESAADPRAKVEARRIANDCYRYIMDLVTNGVVVTDAIKYVNRKMEHLNNQEKKILQDIKDKESAEIVPHQEEESGMGTDTHTEGKTTNGVF